MAKTAIDAKRGNVFMLEPERLTLVTDKKNPLYDPRVENEPDESMIKNIAMNGVLEPIIVRKNGNKIEVVAGRGRTKATIEANKRLVAQGKPPILIPAIIKGGTDADLFGVLISENEIRKEDSIIQKGEKARKLSNMGYTTGQIAVSFGVERETVTAWLEVEELPEPIKNAVASGGISASAALELSGFTREEQVQRFEDLKQQGEKLTVKNVRSAAASADNKPKPKQKPEIKTRMEIEKHMKFHMGPGDFEAGYRKALKWILGDE